MQQYFREISKHFFTGALNEQYFWYAGQFETFHTQVIFLLRLSIHFFGPGLMHCTLNVKRQIAHATINTVCRYLEYATIIKNVINK